MARSVKKKPRRRKSKIYFPKGYSPVPIEIARIIFRIHLIDQLDRRKKGYVRATPGLYRRLSERFNVPHHTVERICCRLNGKKGVKRRVFVRVNPKIERRRMKKRKALNEQDRIGRPDQPRRRDA